MKIKSITINKPVVLGFSILIVIPVLILLLTPLNKDTKKLNTIYHEILNCNLSLNEACPDGILVPTKAEELLTKGISDLTEIRNNLNALDVPDANLKLKILDTLDSNTLLYELTLTFLKNPESENNIALFNEYNNNVIVLNTQFEDLRLLGLTSSSKDCCMDFFEASLVYMNTITKLNREHDITSAQKKDFILSLSSCLKSLNEISEDLKPALESIQADDRSLDVLDKDLKEKKSKLNKIKTKASSLIIPENVNSYYDSFTSVLNFYELYILSLEKSINLDKDTKSNYSQKDIANSYINSFSKYDDFVSSLSEFKTDLDNFNK